MRYFTSAACSYAKIVEIPASEIDRIDFATCAQPRETLGSFYNRQSVKPDVMCNGGLFGYSKGLPCFNYIDEGTHKNESGAHVWGAVSRGAGIKKNAVRVLTMGGVADGNWKDFISGYPVLLDGNGIKTSFDCGSEVNYLACRTMLGWTADRSMYYVVCIGKPGMRFAQMSKFMYGIGCRYAINLDGGGSSRLLVNGKVVNKPTENRAVDNVVCFYLKKSNNTTTTTPNTTAYTTYTVVRGDSLSKIAVSKLGSASKYKEIMALNGLKSTTIRIGQVLKIPSSSSTTKSAGYSIYTVVSGDSWWRIASKKLNSGARYKELAAFNSLSPSVPLTVGQIIKIPA